MVVPPTIGAANGNGASRQRKVTMLAGASIAAALAVMGIKYVAYLVTGSVALYSDALESIVNVLAAAVALVAIVYGAKPADKTHPFGHHKAEFFSAVLEGALIIIAALLVISEAARAILNPPVLDQTVLGLAINGVATALNAGWSALLIRSGKTLRSPALVADGRHIQSDVWTSIGVVVGIGFAAATGWYLLDPLLAIAVAINILWVGSKLITTSLSGLMDEAASPAIQEVVNRAIRTHGDGALEAHDIRTRHAGPVTFIEFHLVVPGQMTVLDAHAICDRIEAELRGVLEGSQVLIHVEPDYKSKSGDCDTGDCGVVTL